MNTAVSEDDFSRLLGSFERTAFRLETRDAYALGYERRDFERFLEGTPVPPPDLDWWRPWLDQITRQASEGKQISRVRILAEPPSDYQRWELWAAPWHAAAGEQIGYLPRSRADTLGLPLDHDWWLLDDTRLIIMRFTPDGEIDGKTLTDDRAVTGPYRAWRDTAVRNSTPAAQHRAA